MSNISNKNVADKAKTIVDKGISDIKNTVNNIDVKNVINTIKENADESIKTVSVFGNIAKENVKSKTAEFIENSKKRLEKANEDEEDNQEKDKNENDKRSDKSLGERKEKNKNIDEILKEVIDDYNSTYEILNAAGMELHYERERSIDLIEFVEDLINSIANKPKSFEKDFEEISTSKKQFKDADDFMKKDLAIVKKQAAGAGAGVAAGAGFVAFAPSAAMWVATTFGTASTGTAISTLSGAAATNAALAWLGGGALAAGGGGMAIGQSILALAGPVGWSIAGASLLASVVLFANNKLKSNKEKEKEIESIKNNTILLRKAIADIDSLTEKNRLMREQLANQFKNCIPTYKMDYNTAAEDQKMSLGTLVNNTKALSKLITLTINCETN